MVSESGDHDHASDLASLLDLEQIDRDLYRGRNPEDVRERLSLYGGQVAAQALRAAGMTVPEGRLPHSLHGYFLRPGRTDLPVILHVDRDRDGGSFSARHVRAVQDGEVIFSMLASFHAVEGAPTSYDVTPRREAVDPEDGTDRGWDRLLEVREVTPTRVIEMRRVVYSDCMWVRPRGPLPDDDLVHACALTYLSDLGSGFGQLDLPEIAPGGSSIDHGLWFATPFRVDDWVLLDLRPAKAGNSRGIYNGSIRGRDGTLLALLAQEVLLRQPRLTPEQLARMAERFN